MTRFRFHYRRLVCRVFGHQWRAEAGAKLCDRCKAAELPEGYPSIDVTAGS